MEFLRVGGHPALDFLNTRPIVGGQAVELLVSIDAANELFEILHLPPIKGFRVEEIIALRESLRAFLADQDGQGLSIWLSRLGPPEAVKLGQLTFANHDHELAPLLLAILDLVTRHDPNRIRKCSNPDCVLWFWDSSKGGRRQWHGMATCGNQSKVRSFRGRKQ